MRQKEAYTVRFVKRPKFTHAKRIGEFFYVPIRRVETVKFSGTVYNIQTSDNTYLVNNVVVHNCYTKLPAEDLAEIKSRKDVIQIVDEEKLDLLADSKVIVRKIVTTDPLAIGGGNDSIRDKITAWEADIKYYENYAYDRGLKMGTFYTISKGEVKALKKEVPERVMRSLEEVSKKDAPEFVPFLKEWAELLGQPLTDFKRVALDIEVANEEGRLPDPEKSTLPVIAVSFFGDTERTVYALRRAGGGVANASALPYSLVIFDDEAEMLRAAFDKMMDYPVIITFNGDNFDLRYLKHRADNLKIGESENPIELQRVESSVKHGIHIDLYNFFKNRSIQVYAFSNKYTEHTLNGISEALIGKSKLEFEGEIGELPLEELAKYCLNDSQLTYELATMGGSVVMKLLLVIARIAKMPMNDVGRLGVSNWIRSMLFYEHRKINALIPRSDELLEKGGASSQAIIKGKKYKGGLVIEPKQGVFFDVSVLDFASLYPSLIKVHNLSYETVNCPHEECRSNVVPDTSTWVCKRRKGITSLVTGSLRDLRVSHYKPLTRDQTLSKEDRELYSVVTQGLKVILNAAYGVMGFETFAFYCLPVAEATAAFGREAITKTIQKCTESGINVLYGDSVTGERNVTLLSPSGHIRVMPIERFFSVAGESITTPDGKEEAYPEGWSALSMDTANGSVNFKPVKKVIRHRSGKKIFRVWERWGCTRVTEDHSLIADENGSLVLAPPTQLSGRHLVRAYRIPAPNELLAVDVYDVLKSQTYRVTYKGRQKVMHAQCDDSWVWYSWTTRKNPIKVRRFILVGTPEFRALVALLAAYVPEGSSSTPDTTKSRLGASISCTDTAWLERLREDYMVLFSGANPSVVASQPEPRHLTYLGSHGQTVTLQYRDMTHKLQMMNELSAVFFKAFCGQKSYGKALPDFIFNVPPEYKRLFLDNLVKGDGSKIFGPRYTAAYSSKNFRYETKSLSLASGLSVLLQQMGINYTVRYRPSKQTYCFATATKHSKRRTGPIVVEEQYDGYVYDLSVEGNHTFVDSCGNIVLKNTDSLFLQNITKDQISMVTKWAEAELGVELDLDKTYRYVAFSSRKKNYFGVLPDGTADVKGLTGRKSQTPEFLKKLFYDTLGILSDVKTQPDFETARSRIKELLGTTMNKLKNREIPVEQLAFNVMISKPTARYNDNTPQHVKAAQLLERSGREIKGGDIISFVKTKAPPYVKPVQLAKPEDVDTDKYIEYAHSMFDQILDALDFSFDEIMGATTLDFFWSS
ncbi:MAG: ribonuclease H-like domain-containing protein [Nitrososphaerales archaeon]|nr:ribonuclease H-like domain-containing protein [Nitrososphaerales archaeon]